MSLPAIPTNWEQILPAILGISVLYARLEALALWLAKRAGVLRLIARVLRRLANALDDTATAAADGNIDAADIEQVARDLTTDQPTGVAV